MGSEMCIRDRVLDTDDPVLISMPADIVVSCSTDVPGDPGVTATDNCGASVTLVYTQSGLPLTCAGNGIVSNTWEATDCNGNTTSYTQTVTVLDTEAPVLSSMPADIVVSCSSDVPGDSGIIATDNCDASVMVVYTQSGLPLTCAGNGVVTNTWEATDCNGNTTSYTQTVTVSYTDDPVLSSMPADLVVSCLLYTSPSPRDLSTSRMPSSA